GVGRGVDRSVTWGSPAQAAVGLLSGIPAAVGVRGSHFGRHAMKNVCHRRRVQYNTLLQRQRLTGRKASERPCKARSKRKMTMGWVDGLEGGRERRLRANHGQPLQNLPDTGGIQMME